MKRTLVASASALALAALAAGTAQAWSLPSWPHQAPNSSAVVAALPAPAAAPLPAGTAPNYRSIVQSQGPAVVGVTVSGLRDANDNGSSNGPQNLPPHFFRGLPGLQPPPQDATPFRGQGSGFIVSADGLVLTNAHVVRDARQVTVKLSDRREFSAQVLGSDPATDIAVLKIAATGLPTVALGDPSSLQVGDYVLAIGAPYGFEQTATQGIVSAKGRSLPGDSMVPFIQTDAAVNPGNSGGPLFDASGRVVGINSQIFSPTGGFQGLAFAIPVNVALDVKDQIVAHGHVEHARMGVSLQDLSAPLAASFGLKAPDGALVSQVMPGSAAAKAGLKAGDVITRLDGTPVRVAGDVSSRVGLARPGDKLTLAIWRDKSAQDLTVVLGKAEPETATASAETGPGASLGLMVRPMAPGELAQAGVDHGLRIERVGGPAQWSGVEAGDVLLALNGQPVNDIEQVREALSKHPSQVALLVSRDGQQIFVPVKLG
jgi:serine protease Do